MSNSKRGSAWVLVFACRRILQLNLTCQSTRIHTRRGRLCRSCWWPGHFYVKTPVAIALFLAIAAAIWGLVFFLPQPESAGLLLIFQLIASIALLLGPIIVYSFVATALNRRAITAVGVERCAERGLELVKVEMHKNHFTLVYRHGEQKQRAKFRVKFVPTTWRIKEVTWL